MAHGKRKSRHSYQVSIIGPLADIGSATIHIPRCSIRESKIDVSYRLVTPYLTELCRSVCESRPISSLRSREAPGSTRIRQRRDSVRRRARCGLLRRATEYYRLNRANSGGQEPLGQIAKLDYMALRGCRNPSRAARPGRPTTAPGPIVNVASVDNGQMFGRAPQFPFEAFALIYSAVGRISGYGEVPALPQRGAVVLESHVKRESNRRRNRGRRGPAVYFDSARLIQTVIADTFGPTRAF